MLVIQPTTLYKDFKLSDKELQAFGENVKGLKIRVTHREGVLRVYRVNGIKASADQLTFEVASTALHVTFALPTSIRRDLDR